LAAGQASIEREKRRKRKNCAEEEEEKSTFAVAEGERVRHPTQFEAKRGEEREDKKAGLSAMSAAARRRSAATASDARLSELFQLSDTLDMLAELKTPNGNRSFGEAAAAAFSGDSSPSSATSEAAAAPTSNAEAGGQEDPWQSRCAELEWSLQRFRDQAQNIRELLREKVSGGRKDRTHFDPFCSLGSFSSAQIRLRGGKN